MFNELTSCKDSAGGILGVAERQNQSFGASVRQLVE